MGQTTQKQRDEWLVEFQAIAAEWGSACLRNEYVNQSARLTFLCAHGHTWSALPMNIYHRGSWCPHCSGNAQYTLKDVRKVASLSGARCLSSKYLGFHKPLDFRCAAGHEFSTRVGSVMVNGVFCAECQKLTLEEFQRLCDSIHYTLLSDNYVKNYTHIHVLCDRGHSWQVQPKHLKEGRRCPGCKGGWRWKSKE
jgi:hypothetical protein